MSDTTMDPKLAVLIQAIRDRSAEDPLVGAKIGAKEISARLIHAMNQGGGVHLPSLLCALGSLAGYACQAALRAHAVAKGQPETAPFQVVGTKDGRQWFFGDSLNQLLAGPGHSVWGLLAGGAQQAGCTNFPDLGEMFQHITSVLGSATFGVPRVPDEHAPSDRPAAYLKGLWPALLPTVELFCPESSHWPVLYGLAGQEAIINGQKVLDPCLALRLSMESALSMSKVDLATL